MMTLEIHNEFMKLLEDDVAIDSSNIQPGQTKIIKPNNLDTLTFQRIKNKLDDIKSDLKYERYHNDPVGKQGAENQIKDHLDKLGLQHIVTFIENNCGDYLDDIQGHRKFLYRGVDSIEHNHSSFFVGNSQHDRKPKDSDQMYHNFWNKALTDMNIKANRSNSIFTSSDYNRAAMYGTLYLIFPFNTASFSWSKTMNDLVLNNYSMSDTFTVEITDEQETKFQSYIDYVVKLYHSEEMMKIRYDVEDKSEFDRERVNILRFERFISYCREFSNNPNKELLHKIDSLLRDILSIWRKIDPDKNYIGFMELIEEISKQTRFDINQFQKKFQISNKHFGLALLSKHEICISGHYMAVKYDYEPYLIDKFFGER